MTCGAQELIELGEPIEGGLQGRLTGSKDASPLQYFFPTREFRSFTNGFGDRFGDPLACQHFFKTRQVFFGSRMLRAFLSLSREAGSHEQSLNESNVTNGDCK